MEDQLQSPEPSDAGDERPDVRFSSPPPPDVACALCVVDRAIPSHMLDPDAVKVVNRLQRFGYEAYLVGGCVRDILFGRKPKDFDVATSAMPAEVKRLFRNCRLIGRRFRLAHLLFSNRKIIEVATFRRSATEEDDVSLRHAAENLFGGPADDAVRRDFTINALAYDVRGMRILDYVGGLKDIDARVLSTIGSPDRRFVEDPVRILRAIKFSARLKLSMGEELAAALGRHAPLLPRCAPARLVEETYKLLRSGASAECLAMLRRFGVLDHLLPELSRALGADASFAAAETILSRMDARVCSGARYLEGMMLAALAFSAVSALFDRSGDVTADIRDALERVLAPLRFPRRHIAEAQHVLITQRRLRGGPRGRRSLRILERDLGREALELLDLTAVDDGSRRAYAAWLAVLDAPPALPPKPAPAAANQPAASNGAPKKRRRRRGRRSQRAPAAVPEPDK